MKRGGSSLRNWGKVEASPLPRQLECSIASEVNGGKSCGPRISGRSRPCLDIWRTNSQRQQWAMHSVVLACRMATAPQRRWRPSFRSCWRTRGNSWRSALASRSAHRDAAFCVSAPAGQFAGHPWAWPALVLNCASGHGMLLCLYVTEAACQRCPSLAMECDCVDTPGISAQTHAE